MPHYPLWNGTLWIRWRFRSILPEFPGKKLRRRPTEEFSHVSSGNQIRPANHERIWLQLKRLKIAELCQEFSPVVVVLSLFSGFVASPGTGDLSRHHQKHISLIAFWCLDDFLLASIPFHSRLPSVVFLLLFGRLNCGKVLAAADRDREIIGVTFRSIFVRF